MSRPILRKTSSPITTHTDGRDSESFGEESSVPLLRSRSAETQASGDSVAILDDQAEGTMKLFDNLRGWDKTKIYRYSLLLILSLSGDGWSYEATVMGSIFQMEPWISHLGYPNRLALPE